MGALAQGPTTIERGWFSEARTALDTPLLWIGVFVGTLSGISAIQRLLTVPLVEVFKDFIDFYRGLLSPLYQWINLLPLPFHVPPIAVDLVAVYSVLLAMSVRATYHQNLVVLAQSGIRASRFKASREDLKSHGQRLLKNRVRTNGIEDFVINVSLVPVLTFWPIRAFFARLSPRRQRAVQAVPRREPPDTGMKLLSALARDGTAESFTDDETEAFMEFMTRRALRRLASKKMKRFRLQSLLAFLALPVAIVAYFILNAYAPALGTS